MRLPPVSSSSLLALLLVAGCTLPGIPAEAIRHEIFFGLSRAGAADVSDNDFDAFVQAEVVPLYPDGFTVLPATGYWRSKDGLTEKEESRVLILHAAEKDDAKLNKLCQKYAAKFGQQAVLRTRSESRSIVLEPKRK